MNLQRRRLLAGAAAPWLAALPRLAHAGAQIEEPLADAVRSALSAAIASSAPPSTVTESHTGVSASHRSTELS